MDDSHILFGSSLLIASILVLVIYSCLPKRNTNLKKSQITSSTPTNYSPEASTIKEIHKLNSTHSIIVSFKIQSLDALKGDDVIQTVAVLASIANVYILCLASSDEQEQRIIEAFQPLVHYMPLSRILFHESEIGKVAFIRQIKPRILIDYSSATCSALKPHVPITLQYSKPSEIINKLIL